ncbi:MAG: beta-glucosidase BglX [Bacteroidetes bacterium]|nr:beta-glucosidase BglX [Bacteroidota bacterium]
MHCYPGFLKSLFLTFIFYLLIQNACAQGIITKRLSRADSIKVENLISQMTLAEKIGQLTLLASAWNATGPAMNANYEQLIRTGKAGAVLNFYTVDKVRELQKLAVSESRLGIPLIFGNDVIHGHRTIFPIPLGQAASWDLTAIEKAEQIAAMEASAEGINWTYAPMVDIARDPRWGRVAEGAGEDTWLGCQIAKARVRGFQGDSYADGKHVLACVKHFAAYGAAVAGRDYNVVDISPVTLHENYLPPYKAAVDAGVASVMTSFNEINGVPSTASHWLLTDLLRKEWGFRGFVVTDWTSINEMVSHGVAADVKAAACLALNAGVDMDMQGSAYLNNLGELLKENQVTLSAIDEAVRHVLAAKAELGLFADPYLFCNKQREQTEIMTKESQDFARELVAESCVLLKNYNNTLPVPPGAKSIALIGPLADSRKDMLGNWYSAGKWEQAVSLLEGFRNRYSKQTKIVYEKGCNINDSVVNGIDAAVKAASEADFVILALGESGDMSGEAASRSNIDLPGMQYQLAEAVIKAGKPTAVVLFNGRPLAISKLNQIAPAILETWFGGTQAGNGITDVLSGDVNPSGKITMSFPRNTGQIPVYYNVKNTGRPYSPDRPNEKYVSRYLDCPNTPLYPFGFGLSYTNFTYAGIKASIEGNSITISANVTNSGKRDGEEVVQLYIQDKVGSITRPLKELKGFKKLMIKKGESVNVSFTISREDLSFYHPDLTKYWEPGEFNAFIGGSSAELISASFKL